MNDILKAMLVKNVEQSLSTLEAQATALKSMFDMGQHTDATEAFRADIENRAAELRAALDRFKAEA